VKKVTRINANCPFCGTRDDNEQTIVREKLMFSKPYQVVCSCGARGPHGETVREAIKEWDARFSIGEREE